MSEMTYRQAGDYQIPNLQLENEGEKPLGKYGRMRRAFLEQNNPMLLNDMILTESLFPHLWEIEETAKARVEFLMEQYLKKGQPRTGQGNAADGVGAAHEQPESTGGRKS